MNDTAIRNDRPDDTAATGARSLLSAEVEGRTVRFWVTVGVLIAVAALGFGAWWGWGQGRATSMDQSMDQMPSTDVSMPAVSGLYDGEEVFFVHPEAPDPDVAGMLTEMVDGSAVLVTWLDENEARVLHSAAEVTAAADAGEIQLQRTNVVVNMPFLTWPQGLR